MTDDTRNDNSGLDLFDFLAEVWRQKFLFLAVFAIVALGTGAHLTYATQPKVTIAVYQYWFSLKQDGFPKVTIGADALTALTQAVARSADLRRQPVDDRYPLADSNLYSLGWDPDNGRGYLLFAADPSRAPERFAGLSDALSNSIGQFNASVSVKIGEERRLIDRIIETVGPTDFAAQRMYELIKVDGPVASLDPYKPEAIYTRQIGGTPGRTRTLVIAILAGLAVAFLAVVIRTGVERLRLNR